MKGGQVAFLFILVALAVITFFRLFSFTCDPKWFFQEKVCTNKDAKNYYNEKKEYRPVGKCGSKKSPPCKGIK